MKKLTQEEFLKKATQIHGNKYDYSKSVYQKSNTKIVITCPIHGDFYQLPSSHLNGCGCPKCAGNETNTKEFFTNKAKKIHGDKYDYSKVKYINNSTKVCIICPDHGEFWQTPKHHLRGEGCPMCNGKFKQQKDFFIKKAQQVHNSKYDYSKVEYINNKTNVCIICPEHGEFWQTPSNHLRSHGCPKCGFHKTALQNTYTENEYMKTSNYHLQGEGCPICGKTTSRPEEEICSILSDLEIEKRNRSILSGKEIDVYVKSLNLGIEYNGLLWHSEQYGKNHRYHLDKLNECNQKGVKLIQIFEDEWINHQEICESKIKQICGLNNNKKLFGRKCGICEITDKFRAYDFLDKNHIQGRTGFTVALGAYYDGKLVGVMTFKKEKEGYWDLNRFCTDINYQCIGLGGKLFKYFTQNYQYEEIKSFADRRWTTDPTNNLYTKLGFKFDSFVEPTYWYYNPKVDKYKRHHKFGFRKQPLHHQYGLPLTMTEREMTESLGYTRIWDCGLIKYIYRKELC